MEKMKVLLIITHLFLMLFNVNAQSNDKDDTTNVLKSGLNYIQSRESSSTTPGKIQNNNAVIYK